MQISRLTCNYVIDPIGVDSPLPKLSWMLESDRRGQLQSAYRIIAASDRERLDRIEGDLWDTGRVESDQSIHIAYGGRPLVSEQNVYWKACVWDKDGRRSPWSETALFGTGLLKPEDWSANAKWIGHPQGRSEHAKPVPAPLFRKRFHVGDRVAEAKVFVSGLGYYELYLNGAKVGDDVLAPGFTNYDETVLYNTYEITDYLNAGDNVFGVILGDGWYNCFTSDVWNNQAAGWRGQPKFILQASIRYEDGDKTTVVSDAGWTCSESPIVFNGLRNGEYYDARLEQAGWHVSEFDDSAWKSAKIVRNPGGTLKSNPMPPIQVTGTITPVSLQEVAPKVWVYDMGQNISGWAQIRVSGPAGTEVSIKYAEKIKADGDIDASNLDCFVYTGDFQTDRYTLKGEGLEQWEPRFTYHGFQYVQIAGFPGTPTLESVRGRVVHTALETRGRFECADPLLNEIQRCARWSTLTNYHDMPTDCPHREKNGWTGDAHLSAEQTLLNFNPITAYAKWMSDFKDAQLPSGQLPGIIPTGGWGYDWGNGPAWDSALFLIPMYAYEYSGDAGLLEAMYEPMKIYLAYLESMSDGYLVEFGLGDWCPPKGEAMDHACPTIVTDTAYFYTDAVIAARTAEILRKPEEAAKFRELALRIRDAFRGRFFDPATGEVTGNCQTSLACALYMGLVDEAEKPLVLQNLADEIERHDGHLDCGILGTKFLLHALTDLGRADIAYSVASRTTFPSWGHWISQGATTLWENWSGENSRNHHMFSDVSAWFYKGLAGIAPDIREPGFKRILLKPNPVPGLDWASATHRSMYGDIVCGWRVEGDRLHIDASVPVNCNATLFVPPDYKGEIRENGAVFAAIAMSRENGRIRIEFGSGTYRLEIARESA